MTAVEVDRELSERARIHLADWPWIDVRHGDGLAHLPAPVDVVVVHAGATHVIDPWLDALADGGRLLVPLTCGMAGMGRPWQRQVLMARRSGGEWTARVSSFLAIYSLIGVRDAQMESALGRALASHALARATRLRRDVHDATATCLLHGATTCVR